jgi:hypothetical protein
VIAGNVITAVPGLPGLPAFFIARERVIQGLGTTGIEG